LPHFQAAFSLKKFTTTSPGGKTHSLDQRYQLFVFPISFTRKDCQPMAQWGFISQFSFLRILMSCAKLFWSESAETKQDGLWVAASAAT
jgi:hypothetical protein